MMDASCSPGSLCCSCMPSARGGGGDPSPPGDWCQGRGEGWGREETVMNSRCPGLTPQHSPVSASGFLVSMGPPWSAIRRTLEHLDDGVNTALRLSPPEPECSLWTLLGTSSAGDPSIHIPEGVLGVYDLGLYLHSAQRICSFWAAVGSRGRACWLVTARLLVRYPAPPS